MATALIDQWVAANGPEPALIPDPTGQAMIAQTFRARVSIAATAAAIAIASEATTTPDHANRVAFAKLVAQSPVTWVFAFAQALAALGLDETSTDAAINSGIASVWNAFAG